LDKNKNYDEEDQINFFLIKKKEKRRLNNYAFFCNKCVRPIQKRPPKIGGLHIEGIGNSKEDNLNRTWSKWNYLEPLSFCPA